MTVSNKRKVPLPISDSGTSRNWLVNSYFQETPALCRDALTWGMALEEVLWVVRVSKRSGRWAISGVVGVVAYALTEENALEGLLRVVRVSKRSGEGLLLVLLFTL